MLKTQTNQNKLTKTQPTKPVKERMKPQSQYSK